MNASLQDYRRALGLLLKLAVRSAMANPALTIHLVRRVSADLHHLCIAAKVPSASTGGKSNTPPSLARLGLSGTSRDLSAGETRGAQAREERSDF